MYQNPKEICKLVTKWFKANASDHLRYTLKPCINECDKKVVKEKNGYRGKGKQIKKKNIKLI